MSASTHLKVLRVFVACPRDVMKERKALTRAVNSLRGIAMRRDLTLDLVDWHDVVPDVGRAEDIILTQLRPRRWDVFVGILWHRFGTPPGASDPVSGDEYQSGTEEEFRLAYRLWKSHGRPKILFYRCKRNIPPETDLNQLRLVNQFFTEFDFGASHPGLYHTFKTPGEFEESVRNHLSEIVDASVGRRRRTHRSGHREVASGGLKGKVTVRVPSARDIDSLASLVLRGVKEIYYRALDAGMRSCPQVRINIMTLDGRSRRLKVRFVDDKTLYTSAELTKTWQPGEGKCGVAWKEAAQQVYASDTSVPSQLLEPMDVSDASKITQLNSVLSTPIQNDGRTVGVLNLDSTYDGAVTKVADNVIRSTFAQLAQRVVPLVADMQ